MKLFGPTYRAAFIERPNRFTLTCEFEGRQIKAYLPNPGRLWELLFPGTTIYIEKSFNEGRKMPYTAVAVERDGLPIMLHTHRTNDAVEHLLRNNRIPGLEGAEIVKREYSLGHSRFDFLLNLKGRELILEVKSCTLFGKRVAMFPDAVTERGKRHIDELAHLSDENRAGAVIFLVNSPRMEAFLPEYHTDLALALSLYAARQKIMVLALSVGWDKELKLLPQVRELNIPWKIVKKEAEDRGCYLFILKLEKKKTIEVGKLGRIAFKKGYYIYVGSAKQNLSKRVERHKRLRKNKHWHIDYFRAIADYHAALPILTADDLECELGNAVEKISNWKMPDFGSSDCKCGSHLFGFTKDPLNSKKFHSILQYFRMDRLIND